MAEIIILILFILLLLLATAVRELEDKLDEFTQSNSGLQNENATLREERNLVLGRFKKPETIDDLFTELRLLKSQAESVPKLQEQVVQLTEKLKESEFAMAMIDRLDSQGFDLKESQNQVRLSEAVQRIATSEISSREDPLARLEDAADQIEAQERRLGDLQGQVRNLQGRLSSGGRGTEKPACWADKETGKTEYIFDISLEPEGLRVRDRALAHRAEAQAALPLELIEFGVLAGPDDFLAATKPLFDWSEANNCRFFVRAFDNTGADQKKLYKERMRTLEEHFYKYEMIDEQF